VGSSGLTTVRQTEASQRRRYKYAPPVVSRPMLRWFLRYAQFYVGRHMHSVRVSQEQNLTRVSGRPLLLYMNHPSWWDPMIAAVLAARYLPDYLHYTPIDAAALKKYRFFSKLGFFGMTQHSFESQRRLMDIAGQVLSQYQSALWITPQGRFSDVRQRPLCIGSGLPHLVRAAPDCAVVPVAIEYSYWEESKPEVLVRFGEPMNAGNLQLRSDTQQVLESALGRTLDDLSRATIARDPSGFHVILSGTSGVGGVYDLWRRGQALLSGDKFRPEHGESRP
jgi:1-acyl-sn-glycerol-3-phosphate acyltransferase